MVRRCFNCVCRVTGIRLTSATSLLERWKALFEVIVGTTPPPSVLGGGGKTRLTVGKM